jgi:hypothetical protein
VEMGISQKSCAQILFQSLTFQIVSQAPSEPAPPMNTGTLMGLWHPYKRDSTQDMFAWEPSSQPAVQEAVVAPGSRNRTPGVAAAARQGCLGPTKQAQSHTKHTQNLHTSRRKIRDKNSTISARGGRLQKFYHGMQHMEDRVKKIDEGK